MLKRGSQHCVLSPQHGSQVAALCCTTHVGRRCLISFTWVAVSPAFYYTVNISAKHFVVPVAPSAGPQAPVEPQQSLLLCFFKEPRQQQVSQMWAACPHLECHRHLREWKAKKSCSKVISWALHEPAYLRFTDVLNSFSKHTCKHSEFCAESCQPAGGSWVSRSYLTLEISGFIFDEKALSPTL